MRTSPSCSAARRSAAGTNGGRCCATSPGQDSFISGFTGAAPWANAVSGKIETNAISGMRIGPFEPGAPSIARKPSPGGRGFVRPDDRGGSVAQPGEAQWRGLLAHRLDVEDVAGLLGAG